MTLPPARTLFPAALAAALAAPPALAADPQGRPPRPAPANARVETLSPELEATLAAWYEATKTVETLEGSHTEVATVHSPPQETHRNGRFYYAQPDRGRIDLRPGNIDGVTGKAHRGAEPYPVLAGRAETWICDGKRVVQLDEPAKEAVVSDLPPEHRGENIINGPLPFLLGVPPETLKARFRIRFVPGMEPKGDPRGWLATPSSPKDQRSYVYLELMPRRESDAQNWSKAMVKLSKPDFLPAGVKLFGPAAGGARPNTETTYAFQKPRANRPAITKIFRGNPFDPNLSGYAVVRADGGAGPAGNAAGAGPRVANIVPAVVGMPYKMASNVMRGRGYEPKLARGPATDRKVLVGKIHSQNVTKGTELKAGSPVELRVYVAAVRPAGATAEAPTRR